MSDNDKKIEWSPTFSGEPGWYWVYQAIPKGAGESFVPTWIETAQTVPLFATAFYGPITPPEMPLTMRPLIYQEKIIKAREEAEKAQNEASEADTQDQAE